MNRIKLLFAMSMVVLMLVACATGTKGVMVSSYELAGTTLKAGLNTAKPMCDTQQLPVDKCAQIKTIYNEGRAAYLLAGDSLAIAVETDDLVKKQAALQDYQGLATKFTKNTTDIINLLVQWGVIKKEVKK
jgi:hypothetical protein